MTLDNTAKLSDIISALQNMQGINAKADVVSVVNSKGANVTTANAWFDIVGAINGLSNVKSVQEGSLNFTGSSIDITINPVDLNKAILVFEIKQVGNTAYSQYIAARGKILNSTTLRFERATASATYYPQIRYKVIEFNNVRSLQRLDFTFDGSTIPLNIAINPLTNISKTHVFYSRKCAGNDANNTIFLSQLYPVDVNNLRLDYGANTNSQDFHAQIIEFN